MKIGIVLDAGLVRPGGVQRYVRGLYDSLERLGQDVWIIGCGEKSKEDEKRKVFLLGRALELEFLVGFASTPITYEKKEKILAFLNKEKFDVLHYQAPFGFLSWQILQASKALSARGGSASGWNVASFHIYHESKPLKIVSPLIRPLTSQWVKKLDGRIALSPAAENFARQIFGGEYEIIPPGVDLSRFARQVPKIKEFVDERVNILFLGRLDKRKGLLDLLRAYKILKRKFDNLRLVVVGIGPQRKEAEELVEKYDLKVYFAGFVSDQDLPRFYVTADIYCAPALYGESFGIVLIEAMASGLPVVAYANEGYKWVLRNKPFSDFLVKPGDVEGLARALEILIKDEGLRKKLGKAGLKEAKKYDWGKVGRQTLEFYKSVSKER